MDDTQRVDAAKDQLNLVLSFFPRVDAKASVILGVDTAMLALLGVTAPPMKSLESYMIFALIPALIVIVSLGFLYIQLFPQLSGGQRSLIYFREVTKRTESQFIEEFLQVEDEAYVKDILSQVWRNSEILTKKFDSLKIAFILTATAIPFWVVALGMFAAKNTELKSLLGK